MLRTVWIALFLVAVLAGASSAQAHPHLFARYKVEVTPADAGFINLHFSFKAHSAANPLRIPDAQAGDTAPLTDDMLRNFQEHPFFLYLDFKGKPQGRQEVTLTAQESKDGAPTYGFDLVLPDTLKDFGFAVYDESYFDFVSLDGAEAVSVKVEGLNCTPQTREVGKTVWGVLRANYVQCGDGPSLRTPLPHLKLQMPDALAPKGNGDLNSGTLIP